MNRLPTPEPGTPSGRCPVCGTPLNSASVIDRDRALWRIPAGRTKEGRPHNVPLSGPALAVLADAWERTGGVGLVFPAATGRAISPATLGRSITRDNEQTGRLRRWFCRCVAGVRNIKKRRDPLGSQTDGIPAGNARPLLEKEQDNE